MAIEITKNVNGSISFLENGELYTYHGLDNVVVRKQHSQGLVYIETASTNNALRFTFKISDGVTINGVVFTDIDDAIEELDDNVFDEVGGGSGMVYPGAGIALSTGTAWTTSVTDNSANWNTSYTDRLKWDGGSTGLVAATGRTSLGLVIGTNIPAINATTFVGTTSIALNRSSAAQVLTGITGLTPSANFVLTQNSVATLTSVESGAIVDTVTLKAGKVGILNNNPTSNLDVTGTGRFTGLLTLASSIGSGNPIIVSDFPTPSIVYGRFSSSTGSITWGVESSSGGNLAIGTDGSAALVGTSATKSLQFFTDTTVRQTIASNGATTFTVSVDTPLLNGIAIGLGNGADSTNTAIHTSFGATASGNSNTGVGTSALGVLTSGQQNTAIGRASLNANTTGQLNTAVGYTALLSNVSGNNNTALGVRSGQSILGSGNLVLGYYAGNYETGSNAFYINNIDQTNTVGDKAFSLMYGTFAGSAGTISGQTLLINATTTVKGQLNLKNNGNVIDGTSSLTSTLYGHFANLSGSLFWGVEDATPGQIFTGTTTYAAVIGTNNNRAFEIASNGNVRLSISGTGNFDFKSGTFTIGGNLASTARISNTASVGGGNAFQTINTSSSGTGPVMLGGSTLVSGNWLFRARNYADTLSGIEIYSDTTTFNGSISTADPTSGAGPVWQLGAIKTVVAATLTLNYVEISVAGVIYKVPTIS